MALHAMTIDPTTGLPTGERPPASTSAVISLVFGVLLCLPFSGLPAILVGILAYLGARRDPTRVGGGTMAVIGIGLGVLNLLGWGVMAVLWILSVLMNA